MKHLSISLIIGFLIGSVSRADTKEFSFPNYDQASQATNFVRFDMASTKFGVLTTFFTGFIRNFKIDGTIKDTAIVPGASIEFLVTDLDTDVDGRNEKMWEDTLDSKQNPKVLLTLEKAVPLNQGSIDIPAVLKIRGQDHPLTLKVKASLTNGNLIVDILGEASIKALLLPDPSILIATVRDRIDIKSHFELTRK